MWVVFLTTAACAVLGTLIWLGFSIRKAFGKTALIGACTFAACVASFITLAFLVAKEVQG